LLEVNAEACRQQTTTQATFKKLSNAIVMRMDTDTELLSFAVIDDK